MITYKELAPIVAELRRATAKHPHWPDDCIHAAAIVAEESGELVRAALRYTYEGGQEDEMRTEAIHTAATAIRFLVIMQQGKACE